MLDKYVRVMTDYCSDGLWSRDGCMMSWADLPISDGLKARHKAWCDAYEYNDDYKPPEERRVPLFDIAAHAAEGLAIARLIKAELPDWTVIYFDESKIDHSRDDQPRSEFEYEIASAIS